MINPAGCISDCTPLPPYPAAATAFPQFRRAEAIGMKYDLSRALSNNYRALSLALADTALNFSRKRGVE